MESILVVVENFIIIKVKSQLIGMAWTLLVFFESEVRMDIGRLLLGVALSPCFELWLYLGNL
mgnify:CR=1 FL=1